MGVIIILLIIFNIILFMFHAIALDKLISRIKKLEKSLQDDGK